MDARKPRLIDQALLGDMEMGVLPFTPLDDMDDMDMNNNSTSSPDLNLVAYDVEIAGNLSGCQQIDIPIPAAMMSSSASKTAEIVETLDDRLELESDDRPEPEENPQQEERPEERPELERPEPDDDSVGFTCHCSATRRFQLKSSLTRHMKSHTGVHKCHICSRTFEAKHRLSDHMNSAHMGTAFPCSTCDKSYKSKTALKRHIKLHEPAQYSCSTCGEEFHSKDVYQRHANKHLDVRPFVCDNCNKSFRVKHDLSCHLQICGQNSDNLKCSICFKSFKHKKYLSEHIKCHQNPIKWQCSQCGNTYNQKASLTRHMKKCN